MDDAGITRPSRLGDRRSRSTEEEEEEKKMFGPEASTMIAARDDPDGQKLRQSGKAVRRSSVTADELHDAIYLC